MMTSRATQEYAYFSFGDFLLRKLILDLKMFVSKVIAGKFNQCNGISQIVTAM